MDKIKSVTVVTCQGVSVSKVGTDGITDIKDDTIDNCDNIYIRQFLVYRGDKLFKHISNCPVEIEYFTE